MVDRNLLKQHIQILISKNVLSEEVVNDLEAVIMVIDQDPVRPEWDPINEEHHCPICGGYLEGYVGDYCSSCGRRIDWDGA